MAQMDIKVCLYTFVFFSVLFIYAPYIREEKLKPERIKKNHVR